MMCFAVTGSEYKARLFDVVQHKGKLSAKHYFVVAEKLKVQLYPKVPTLLT